MSLSTCPSQTSPRYCITLSSVLFSPLYAHHVNGVGGQREELPPLDGFNLHIIHVLPVSATSSLSFDPATQCIPLCLSAFLSVSPSVRLHSPLLGFMHSWLLPGCRRLILTGPPATRSSHAHPVPSGWSPAPFSFCFFVIL